MRSFAVGDVFDPGAFSHLSFMSGGAVGVDAALGEVVGATAGHDESTPTVPGEYN